MRRMTLAGVGRALAWLCGVLVTCYLFYVLMVFGLLHSGIFSRWIESEEIRLDVRSGYSFWPGHFVVRDADFIVQDYDATIQIEARKAHLELDLLGVLRREVHIKEAIGTGVAFRLRYRVEDAAKHHKRIGSFPVMKGFERPIQYQEPESPQVANPIKVFVDHLKADIEEVWILEYRSEGAITAEGGFEILEQVSISDAVVDLSKVDVFVGEAPVAKLGHCLIQANLRFPSHAPQAADILEGLSTRVDCDTRTSDLSIVEQYTTGLPISVSGELINRTHLHVVQGRPLSGAVEWESKQVVMGWRDSSVTFPFAGRAAVAEPGEIEFELGLGAEQTKGLVTWRDLEVHGGVVLPTPRRPQLKSLVARGERLQVGSTLIRELSGDSSLPAIEARDLDLQFSTDTQEHSAEMTGELAWHLGGQRTLTGALRLSARCGKNNQGHFCPEFALSVSPLAFRAGLEKGTTSISLQARRLELASSGDMRSDWELKGENPREFLVVAGDLSWLETAGVSLLRLGRIDAAFSLNRNRNTWGGQLGRAQLGQLQAKGHFVMNQSVRSAWIVSSPVLGRLGVNQCPENLKVVPFASRAWLETPQADLTAPCR